MKKIYTLVNSIIGCVFHRTAFLFVMACLCCCMIPNRGNATHVVGSDITYKCTGNPGFFEVTLVVYRKCGAGVADLCPASATCANLACTVNINVLGADPGCSTTTFMNNVPLQLVSVRDASPSLECPTAKNICTNLGCVDPGTYPISVERYEFKGMINVGPTSGIPANCCNVRITYNNCCRNSNIATGSADQPFYVDAIINRCLSVTPCNSSPVLTNDPFAIICGGQNYVFNNGAVDPDLDSLSYSFTPALIGYGGSVNYSAPFAYDRPMPWTGSATGVFPAGISCDPLTGDIMFTPPNAGALFAGVMAVEIKQWKLINGVMTVVGITRRDVQMVVRGDCLPNNPPRLITNPPDESGNVNIPRTAWSVCAGDQLCFTVTAKDTDFNPPTRSDTTYLSWNAALAGFGATFKPDYDPAMRRKPDSLGGGPREDRYRFCWTPDESKASTTPYYFTITGKDDRCPDPGRITRAFSILVIGKANLQINKSNLKCGKWGFSYTNLTPKFVPITVQWQISRVPGDQYMTNNPYTYNNTSNPGTIQFNQGGRYYILVKAVTPGPIGSPGCEKIIKDSFDVDSVMLVQKRDTLVCLGSTVEITAAPKHGIPSYSYRWYNSITDTATAPLNSSVNSPLFTVGPTATRYYTIQIRDINGCKAYDSVRVEAKSLPVGLLPVDARICYEDSFILNPGNNGGNIKKFLWNTSDTTQTITRRDSNEYIVTITDTFGCWQKDTMMLYVNRKVLPVLGPDKALCEGSTAVLKGQGGYQYEWFELGVTTPVKAKSYSDTLQIKPTNTTTATQYMLKAYLSYPDTAAKNKECWNTDTISVTVNPLPKLKRPNPAMVCFTEPVTGTPTFFLDGTQPGMGGAGSSGVWSYPQDPSALVVGVGGSTQVQVPKLKNIPTKDTIASFVNWIKYTFTGATAYGNCVTVDSAIVKVYGTPPTNAGPDVKRCDISGLYDITRTHPFTPQNALHKLEYWTGPGVDSSVVSGVNYFTFNPKGVGVQPLPAQNILTYLYGKDYGLIETNAPKCYKSDQMIMEVTAAPVIKVSQDILVCENEQPFLISSKTNATITPSAGTAPYWEASAADGALNTKGAIQNGQTFIPSKAGDATVLPIGPNSGSRSYQVYFKDTSTGCLVQSPIKISIARVPKADLYIENQLDSNLVCENSKSVVLRMSATRDNSATSTWGPNSDITYSTNPASGAAFGPGSATAQHVFNSNIAGPGSYMLTTKYMGNKAAGPPLGFTAFAGCAAYDSVQVIVQARPVISIAIPDAICSYDTLATVKLATVPVPDYGFKWILDPSADGTYTNDADSNTTYRPGAADVAAGMVWIRAQSVKNTKLAANGDQCAEVFDSTQLNIFPAPQALIIPIDSEGCVEYTGNFAAGPTGVANAEFNWSWNGTPDPDTDSLISKFVEFYEPSVKGIYTLGLTVKSTYGTTVCATTAQTKDLITHAMPVPKFTMTPPYTTIAKPFFDFQDLSTTPDNSKLNYKWNLGPGPDPRKPGDRIVTVQNPTNVEYAADTAWQKVWLTVTTEFGCTDSIQDSVRIEPDITVFIPNAFRPNSQNGNENSTAPCLDGNPSCNKVFRIVASGHLSIEVYIYNRWGQLVFESKNQNPEWDGTVNNDGKTFCPQDVYIYQVNATSYNGKPYKYSGSVTLLR
jgi:gliding motility-associated-like protein